jgi:uncharacterized protein YjbI with pentapeptide repeats
LDVIAGGDTLSAQVSSLIGWAERNGYTSDLINAAQRANPKNPLLSKFVDKHPILLLSDTIEIEDKEDRTTIEIVIKGSPDKATVEQMLNLVLSVPSGTIKITKMTPVNSTQITIELPKSKVLNLYSMAKNGLLEGTKVITVSLARVDLLEEDLTGANLAGADLTRAKLTGADLTGADLTGAKLTRAKLTRAKLIGAKLTGAKLTGANLAGADLTRAKLIGAKLIGANLAGANLAGADLTRAKLIGAKLIGAKLAGANLAGADLAHTNLYGADLTGAKLILTRDDK